MNLLDYSEICSIQSNNWPTDRCFNWELPGIWASAGTVKLYNLLLNCDVNNAGTYLYIAGDSITEGDGITVDAERWTTILKQYFDIDSVVVSGRCGGTIYHVLERIKSEAAILKPKYIMVTIGTNGRNTVSNLSQLIDDIRDIGAIPILNRVPAMASGLHNTYNNVIENVVNTKNVLSCRFDIATSKNYNISSGCDTTLFSDGVHPNVNGCIRMATRIKIDLPFLFKNNI